MINFDKLSNKINIGDTIYIKHANGKISDMDLIRKEKDNLVFKSDISCNQEIYINREIISGQINITNMLVIHNDMKSEYSTQMRKIIDDLKEERLKVIKAYMSNNFCDNNISLNIIESLTNMIFAGICTRIKQNSYL